MTTTSGDTKTVVSYEMEEEKIKKVWSCLVDMYKYVCVCVQVTRVFRIERKRVPKPVAARKKWEKFGDAASDVQGPDPATTKIADEVFLTLTTGTTVSHTAHPY